MDIREKRRISKAACFALPTAALAGLLLYASLAAPAAPPVKRAAPKGKAAPVAPVASVETSGKFAKDALPFATQYCLPCHSGKEPAGGVGLSDDKTLSAMLLHRKVWERVADNVDGKRMPPEGSPQPPQADRDRLVAYVQGTLAKADCQLKDPGRVTLHRLNRAEYNNTVRDLLGTDLRPADDFPSDDVGYGFDNIGDVLSMSPLLMEKYMAAARHLSQAVILSPEDIAARKTSFVLPAQTFDGNGTYFATTNSRTLTGNGETGVLFDFPAAGHYTLNITAFEKHVGTDQAQIAARLDGATLLTIGIGRNPTVYPVEVNIPYPGKHRLSVAFLNFAHVDADPANKKLRTGDRNVSIQQFELKPGPDVKLPAPAPPASQARVIFVRPKNNTDAALDAATRRNMAIFARRAYRRPATPQELDRLTRVARLGRAGNGSFERGMQVALQAALVSPNFLFRVERDPDPLNPQAKHVLTDYELATRLSYFLWSSTPDDHLLNVAAEGKLHTPQQLNTEAQRMLRDPRAHALADNFAAQWLQLRKLAIVAPDPQTFPQFNDALRTAMRTETEMFFLSVINEDRSVLTFLDADYTFVNEPLARLYGINNIKGDNFQRIKLTDGQRGGLLTQASVLTVTSNPTRTSPVKRGKWVMENLLGSPIPPPPANVGELPDDKKEALVGTLRQRLEQHRANPSCASCHQRMDPIGFGMENYNAIGQWRTLDGGLAIDTSGALPGGKAFKGPAQLKAAIHEKAPQFVHNLSEKMLTYALGRGIESYDRCNVDTIAEAVTKHDYRFSSLIGAIVTSEPFRNRRGDGPAPLPGAVVKVAAHRGDRAGE